LFYLWGGENFIARGRGWELSEGDIQVLKNELEHIKGQIGELKAEVKCLNDKVQRRLPVWATFLISALFAAVTWFVGH
jgi:hypothetical protein